MPKATFSSESKRFELKSLPDGYVVIKRMSYGQSLQRREMGKITLALSKGRDTTGEMALANKEASYLEFSWCIEEHNLEDENGQLLNLSNRNDIDRLDPRIGQEIDSYINEMNNFEDDDTKTNWPHPLAGSNR